MQIDLVSIESEFCVNKHSGYTKSTSISSGTTTSKICIGVENNYNINPTMNGRRSNQIMSKDSYLIVLQCE